MECSLSGCHMIVHAKKLCSLHYRRTINKAIIALDAPLTRNYSRPKHGLSDSKEHRVWQAMKSRCYYKTHNNYKDYGGRGITVCEKWKNDFMAFYKDMGKCPKGYSIDRINNDGNYEPSNCRWADQTHQNINRRYPKGSGGERNIYKHGNRWRVLINRYNKVVYDKRFSTKEEAILAKERALNGV